MLLETAKPVEPPRPSGRSSSMRVVSRTPSVPAPRHRVGSMIVHDTDDEVEDARDLPDSIEPNDTRAQSRDPAGPSTRRKAKETQYRLGVGRPTAIGGSGPRTITTSSSKPRSRGKRTKLGTSAQPAGDAIQEEDEGNVHPHPPSHLY